MEKKPALKVNKIIVLSAAIGVVTIIIAMAFVIIPFINKDKMLKSEIMSGREKNVLIGKIRALGRHLKVYEKRIPEPGRGVSWLLGEVSDMAAKERIEVNSTKPGAPEDRGLYVKLYVVMDTVSTYSQLGRFISKVESYEKFLRVEQITVKRLDLDKDFDRNTSKFKPFDVKANIMISAVIFKE
ncbi:MAG: type 4a pilus biogenesis protein PilO [Candidatus Omnitrophica bacterium]|nr:type 4a pilus biogenesis protein PilO [Candidatus Omnitrophota bacterium]